MWIKRGAIVVSGLLAMIAIGFIDYLIGYDISLSLFFLVPMLLVTRYAGKYPGYFLAVSSAVTWLFVDRGLHPEISPVIPSINLLLRMFVFVVFVSLFARIQVVLADQRRIIGELRDAAEKIKILKGFIPICSWCKKIRNDEGYWEQLEQYLHTHSEAEFTHGICPECKEKILPLRNKEILVQKRANESSGKSEPSI